MRRSSRPRGRNAIEARLSAPPRAPSRPTSSCRKAMAKTSRPAQIDLRSSRNDHAEEIVGLARDQMDLRVGALPTEIAVEAGDTRRRLVTPALILELLRGKIERPSPICEALAVRFHDGRHRPVCRSERNIVFDQLAHASIARSI